MGSKAFLLVCICLFVAMMIASEVAVARELVETTSKSVDKSAVAETTKDVEESKYYGGGNRGYGGYGSNDGYGSNNGYGGNNGYGDGGYGGGGHGRGGYGGGGHGGGNGGYGGQEGNESHGLP